MDHGPEGLESPLDGWFGSGDETALADAVAILQRRMWAPPAALRTLGEQAIDDLRSELIWRLLRADGGALRGKPHPGAYARAAWRNALAGELRKWGPRSQKAPDVRRHIEVVSAVPGDPTRSLDAERAIELAGQLQGKGRLALLLTTRPDALPQKDWADLVASLPPPPPRRPDRPLDREEASLLLFPPDGEEDPAVRRRRKNNFDRTYSRAIDRLRQLLLPDDS